MSSSLQLKDNNTESRDSGSSSSSSSSGKTTTCTTVNGKKGNDKKTTTSSSSDNDNDDDDDDDNDCEIVECEEEVECIEVVGPPTHYDFSKDDDDDDNYNDNDDDNDNDNDNDNDEKKKEKKKKKNVQDQDHQKEKEKEKQNKPQPVIVSSSATSASSSSASSSSASASASASASSSVAFASHNTPSNKNICSSKKSILSSEANNKTLLLPSSSSSSSSSSVIIRRREREREHHQQQHQQHQASASASSKMKKNSSPAKKKNKESNVDADADVVVVDISNSSDDDNDNDIDSDIDIDNDEEVEVIGTKMTYKGPSIIRRKQFEQAQVQAQAQAQAQAQVQVQAKQKEQQKQNLKLTTTTPKITNNNNNNNNSNNKRNNNGSSNTAAADATATTAAAAAASITANDETEDFVVVDVDNDDDDCDNNEVEIVESSKILAFSSSPTSTKATANAAKIIATTATTSTTTTRDFLPTTTTITRTTTTAKPLQTKSRIENNKKKMENNKDSTGSPTAAAAKVITTKEKKRSSSFESVSSTSSSLSLSSFQQRKRLAVDHGATSSATSSATQCTTTNNTNISTSSSPSSLKKPPSSLMSSSSTSSSTSSSPSSSSSSSFQKRQRRRDKQSAAATTTVSSNGGETNNNTTSSSLSSSLTQEKEERIRRKFFFNRNNNNNRVSNNNKQQQNRHYDNDIVVSRSNPNNNNTKSNNETNKIPPSSLKDDNNNNNNNSSTIHNNVVGGTDPTIRSTSISDSAALPSSSSKQKELAGDSKINHNNNSKNATGNNNDKVGIITENKFPVSHKRIIVIGMNSDINQAKDGNNNDDGKDDNTRLSPASALSPQSSTRNRNDDNNDIVGDDSDDSSIEEVTNMVDDVNDKDIRMGAKYRNFEGNQTYRKIVREFQTQLERTDGNNKVAKVAQAVIDHIHNVVGGRFLKVDQNSQWHFVPRGTVVKKISMALVQLRKKDNAAVVASIQNPHGKRGVLVSGTSATMNRPRRKAAGKPSPSPHRLQSSSSSSSSSTSLQSSPPKTSKRGADCERHEQNDKNPSFGSTRSSCTSSPISQNESDKRSSSSLYQNGDDSDDSDDDVEIVENPSAAHKGEIDPTLPTIPTAARAAATPAATFPQSPNVASEEATENITAPADIDCKTVIEILDDDDDDDDEDGSPASHSNVETHNRVSQRRSRQESETLTSDRKRHKAIPLNRKKAQNLPGPSSSADANDLVDDDKKTNGNRKNRASYLNWLGLSSSEEESDVSVLMDRADDRENICRDCDGNSTNNDIPPTRNQEKQPCPLQRKRPPPLENPKECQDMILNISQRLQAEKEKVRKHNIQNALKQQKVSNRKLMSITPTYSSRLRKQTKILTYLGETNAIGGEGHTTLINSSMTVVPTVDEENVKEETKMKVLRKKAKELKLQPYQYKNLQGKFGAILDELSIVERFHPDVHTYISSILYVSPNGQKEAKVDVPSQYISVYDNIEVLNAESINKKQNSYESVMESYRDFCVQCKTFDCTFHDNRYPDAGTQAAVAIKYDKLFLSRHARTQQTIDPNDPLSSLIISRGRLIFLKEKTFTDNSLKLVIFERNKRNVSSKGDKTTYIYLRGNITCPFCKFNCIDEEKLSKHLSRFHQDSYVCKIVDKTMTVTARTEARDLDSDNDSDTTSLLLRNLNKKKTSWTEEEDNILFENQRKFGNKWTEIQKLLPGRSTSETSNRYHNQKTAQSRQLERDGASKRSEDREEHRYIDEGFIPERTYYHSRNLIPYGNKEDFERDSDDESDYSWYQEYRDELIYDITDITLSEKRMQSMWNRFLGYSPIVIFDKVVPKICFNFIEKHKGELKELELEWELYKMLIVFWERRMLRVVHVEKLLYLFHYKKTMKFDKQDQQFPLTNDQKVVVSRLFVMFETLYTQDQDVISRVGDALRRNDLIRNDIVRTPVIKEMKLSKSAGTKRNRRRRIGAELKDFYFPCHHKGACSKQNNCTCIENDHVCTKHCMYGEFGVNFFKGCSCTTSCKTSTCPCRDNNRECDPDVCKCCAGCNDDGCANMDATMGRRVPLLVGKSSIDGAGLGLFTKNALKKGDYIDEYIGELIGIETEDTAYYFDLTKDFVMDATKQGNKTRYLNHSTRPNVEARQRFVNGENRIAFYSKRDILAQSELCYSYGKNYNRIWRSKGLDHLCQDSDDDEMESTDM